MKSLILALMLIVVVAGTCFAASQYNGDGAWSSKLEVQRWLINRARFSPEQEADYFNMTNSTSGGHPDYDCCEDITGANDFGTTVGEWEVWKASKPPLAPNALLTTASDNHSKDMCEQDVFDHYSPSTNYYPLGSSPGERTTAEGYINNISGYYENISWGMRSSSGSYPSYGRTSEDCQRGLYQDYTSSVRGHRQAILNPNAREIGIGTCMTNTYSDPWYQTQEYFTQDFQYHSGDHFFTGTIFYDTNADKAYSEGEGIGNVEVHLFDNSIEGTYYDVSTPAGSFAIPIADHTDGNEISVQLVNKTGGPVTLSIPMGWGTLGEISLTNNEEYTYGTFIQPGTDANVGFRETDPVIENTSLLTSTGNAALSFTAFKGATYVIMECTNLVSGTWTQLTEITATGTVHTITDPGTATTPAKYYRTYLKRD